LEDGITVDVNNQVEADLFSANGSIEMAQKGTGVSLAANPLCKQL